MYIKEFRDMVVDDPYPMYQVERELIEADGEAEAIWKDEVIYLCYAEKHFYAIDDHSNEKIELDITDYIGDKVFDRFSSVLMHLEEEEVLSSAKFDSWYLACLNAKR